MDSGTSTEKSIHESSSGGDEDDHSVHVSRSTDHYYSSSSSSLQNPSSQHHHYHASMIFLSSSTTTPTTTSLSSHEPNPTNNFFDIHHHQQQQYMISDDRSAEAGGKSDLIWSAKRRNLPIRPQQHNISNHANFGNISSSTPISLPGESINPPPPPPEYNYNPSSPSIHNHTTTADTNKASSKAAAPSSSVDQQASSSSNHKNPKKRTRASRRAPTTVLTTDTSNFRQMVQEFTGIPTAPFNSAAAGTASLYNNIVQRRQHIFRPGLDDSTASLGHPAFYHPLRPSAHKISSNLLSPSCFPISSPSPSYHHVPTLNSNTMVDSTVPTTIMVGNNNDIVNGKATSSTTDINLEGGAMTSTYHHRLAADDHLILSSQHQLPLQLGGDHNINSPLNFGNNILAMSGLSSTLQSTTTATSSTTAGTVTNTTTSAGTVAHEMMMRRPG